MVIIKLGNLLSNLNLIYCNNMLTKRIEATGHK